MARSWLDKFINAALWSAGTSYIFFACNFLGQIILARILLPENFGTYAYLFSIRELAMIVVGIATTQSLIYTNVSQKQFNACFIINIFSASALLFFGIFGLLIFLYNQNLSSGLMLLALTISQIFTLMSYIYVAPLEKELNYKVVAIVQGLSTVIGTIFAIIFAWKTKSTWSLILKEIIASITVFSASYYFAPKKFTKNFEWNDIKSQLSFGTKTAISRGLEIICYSFPDIVIKNFFGKAALGNFYQARYLCYLPMKLISPFTHQVLFSFFTNIKDNKQEMSKNLFWIHYCIILLLVPISLAIYLWGDFLIYLLYGEKWLSAGIYFQYCSLFILFGTLFKMVQSICYSLALQKHVSIAYSLGIMAFISGVYLIKSPELSTLIYSLAFVIAYLYLIVAITKHKLNFNLIKIYFFPILMTCFMSLAYTYLNTTYQIISFILLISTQAIYERKNLEKLYNRIVRKNNV